MMYFVIFIGIIFLLYLLGYIIKDEIDMSFMNRNFTKIIKGFSIFTVVWAHSGDRLGVGGIQFIAGVGVALFLICSGYGLECSYCKNGLKGFWKKRFLNVAVPFWIVELIGLLLTGKFTLVTYLFHFLFIKSGWFLQYIIICYIIFFAIKIIKEKFLLNDKRELTVFIVFFVILFILESTVNVNPDIPFLRARQALSFPCGLFIAKYRKSIKIILDSKNISIFFLGGIIGFAFMAVTQHETVKKMPYIVSNMLSIWTCFPLAIAVIALMVWLPKLFKNKFLVYMGDISYELYLVHTFTLDFVSTKLLNIVIFIIVTAIAATVLHMFTKRGLVNGEFICSNSKR